MGGNKRNFGIDAVESHCDAVTYQYGNGYGVFLIWEA